MTSSITASCVALIPARAGSKRVPGKNRRLLAGKPLLAYTIQVALDSGLFSQVIVSTEDAETATLARELGAQVPFLRNAQYAQDSSPDIDWVREALLYLQQQQQLTDAFALLRPTSPFRTVEMLQRAWAQFLTDRTAHSLRAVERCGEHPAKQWIISTDDPLRMQPVMANPDPTQTPWHSSPYQSLPEVYSQNASLEIAWSRIPLEMGSIAGTATMPFITQGLEGFDINTPEDWILAEHYSLKA